MSQTTLVTRSDGASFEDGADRGRILVSGRETGGRYSLMEYVVAPCADDRGLAPPSFGPHRHRDIEETFLVQRGRLRFLLEQEIFDLGPGDFLRVPPGSRHGFANISKEEVHLLVSFHPGGFEELFVKHRTDQRPLPPQGAFIEEATKRFASEFER